MSSSGIQPAKPAVPKAPSSALRQGRVAVLALALAIAAVFLALAVRGADLGETLRKIGSARPGSLLAGAALFSCASYVRSWRWRGLLSAHARVGAGLVFWAAMTGLAGNNFLPFRAGEVLRSALIGIASGISKTYAMATVIIERFADTLILLALVPLLLPNTLGLPPGFTRTLNWITVALLAAAALLPWSLGRVPTLSRLIQRVMPLRLHNEIERITGNLRLGLGSVLHWRRASMVLLLTVLAWAVDACAAMIIAGGMGLHLNTDQALTLLALLGLSSALPSTPGYVGIYQFVAVTVLAPFRFSRNEALAYITVFQGINYLQVMFWTLLGAYVFRDVAAKWRLRAGDLAA